MIDDENECIKIRIGEKYYGKSLLDALISEGVIIDSPCSGGGRSNGGSFRRR